ncbi:jg4669 [Pararge aegeria aegeria]|uniref:Jg4669 protein n=1 Tax=Pararge aegeria aegeria TaxID=348720 RepID=A0A8S4QBQ6_9NEOP|nr:jg4669 [Pararge aegeria aegeria]
MVHVAKQKRKKWDKKSVKCILTGYPDNIKGYRVYNPETRTVFTSRDVVIIEPEVNSECMIQVQNQNVASVGDKVKPEQQGQKVTSFESTSSLEDSSNSENYYSYDDVNDKTYVPSDYEDSESILQCKNEDFMDRPRRTRKPPERYSMSNLCASAETYDDGAGLTLKEALKGPEKNQWMLAMQEELQCFKENDAWELCDSPQDGRVVQCKWVLRKKYDCDNNVRFRARLVAKGFSHIKGIDYTETLSPVVRHTTISASYWLYNVRSSSNQA